MRMLLIAVTVVALGAWGWSAQGPSIEARWPEWRTRAAHFLNRAAREVEIEAGRRARELIGDVEIPGM